MPSWPDDYFLAIPVLSDKLYMYKNIVGIVAPIPSHPITSMVLCAKQ